ncbi:hypothetical protein Tco_0473032 [Tanacetum coccineum]
MNDKMKTPLWTEQNIKNRPPDYSKVNYLATFIPQTQLTPGQIFWSKDVLKMKAEALKEQTTPSRPIKALMVFTEMHDAHTVVQAHCLELEAELPKLHDKVQKDDYTELVKRFSKIEITQLTEKVTVLQEQNELFRAENAKIKQHYKELYDSIKITRAKHIEQKTALLTENENLKAQIHENIKCITMDSVKPIVLAPGR